MGELLDVVVGETVLKVDCAAQHEWFWAEVNRGGWEQDTFQALRENVGPDTLYVDIGTWIGPTLLYAGARARRVVGVEPDAVAMAALLRNLELNPEIKAKVALHNHALAAEDGPVEMWSSGFGDSMTTCIPGRGSSKMTFLAMGVERFLDMALGDEPHLMIKVDVESAEYDLVPALCRSLKRRGVQADLYVSFHASIIVDEARTMRRWAENLERNGRLLATLAAYGAIHVFEGAWIPVIDRPGGHAAFSSWLDTGGTDHTFLIRPDRAAGALVLNPA